MEYSKFEFRDFNGSLVVAAPKRDESEAKIEQIVTDAVVDALHENIGQPEAIAEDPPEPIIDAESIRAESYQNGYNDAKAHFEPLLNVVKEDELLVSILKSKLEAILPVIDGQEQIFTLSAKALSVLSKKLHLAVPADFEKIILGEMMSILNKYYKTGAITIHVHPERVDYCENLLKINALPARIIENIKIEPAETLGKSDCTLAWNETEIQYSQEQIIRDTDAILEHLIPSSEMNRTKALLQN